jgi:anhydro-N-acetylmuramic acid kinase
MVGTIRSLGVMSGTSLDGLDLACCRFTFTGCWQVEIEDAVTIPYSEEWRKKLQQAPLVTKSELMELHKTYGRYIAEQVTIFITGKERPDLIASHGHTVFHEPAKGVTLQIGDGVEIATETGITTVFDFRTADVAKGGQGAPLVPVGDHYLFGEYSSCLNLGGFANISYVKEKQRKAFDICPVNIVLNQLAESIGQQYDKEGETGRKGNVSEDLLNKLDALPYYRASIPKSLSREWVEREVNPLLKQAGGSLHDQFRTVYEHIANRIADVLPEGRLLVTGGGAYNRFLLELIRQRSGAELIIPDKQMVDFKEAMVFAFLGVLRINDKVNCFSSVTGAESDSSAGIVARG